MIVADRRQLENTELRTKWDNYSSRPWVTLQEYAEEYSIDPRTVKKWGEAGIIEIVRVQLPGQRAILRVAHESPRKTPVDAWVKAYAASQPEPSGEPNLPAQCGVYFIQCGEYVKIGRAADLQQRYKGLSTGTPFPLSVLHFIPCNDLDTAVSLERQMHTRFHHLRHRGEWFRHTDELKRYLRENASNTLAASVG